MTLLHQSASLVLAMATTVGLTAMSFAMEIPGPLPQAAGDEPLVGPVEQPDGTIHVGDLVFPGWLDYLRSDYFRNNGLRCGFKAPEIDGGSPSDCSLSGTNPSEEYDPGVAKYRIPVVVHVIRTTSGTTGHISEAMVQSQIDILNEDFLALAGTYGEDGTDVQLEFYLATEDPDGNPTTGITYSNNTTWYNDGGAYYNSLYWDTRRYLNIYTNSASGALGYVPALPQQGIVGSPSDRVVILWTAFGRSAPIGPPYNQGRTATHEVGHYIGLYHVFNGGCGTSSCYFTGDRICDTNPTENPTFGCGGSSCGSPDAYDNYMDYSYDLCMERFTLEQSRRMRCTLQWYRPDLPQPACSPSTGDVNGDGTVDVADLLIVLGDWNCQGSPGSCAGDTNCDGVTDVSDLLKVLASWD